MKKYTKKNKNTLHGGSGFRPRLPPPPPSQPKPTWSEKTKMQKLGTVAKGLVWNAPVGIITSPFKFLAGSYEWQKKRRTRKLEDKYRKAILKKQAYVRQKDILGPTLSAQKYKELILKISNQNKTASRAHEHLSKGKRLGAFTYEQMMPDQVRAILARQKQKPSPSQVDLNNRIEYIKSQSAFYRQQAELKKLQASGKTLNATSSS